MLDFAFCTLIKVLLFLLYLGLSLFLTSIYLNYFFWSLKYQPLISSCLPQGSNSVVCPFLCMTFALINLPVFPLGILFVYCFQGPEIWEKGRQAKWPHSDRQQTSYCCLLSEVVADGYDISKNLSVNTEIILKDTHHLNVHGTFLISQCFLDKRWRFIIK